MRVLVFGGRDYPDKAHVFGVLDRLHADWSISLLIEGEAGKTDRRTGTTVGADLLARRWAESRGVPFRGFPAPWHLFGNRAGPWRNQKMITDGKPDAAVEFPGGVGTADMRRRIERAGILLVTADAPHATKEG